MEATLIFLGSGTSMGVPTLGCFCPVCTSPDPLDRRSRPSVAVRWTEQDGGSERVVIIDTGPDFRAQVLQAGIARVDAVFYTHGHADHILGLDDLRPFSFQAHKRGDLIPLFADPCTSKVLQRVFDYTFSSSATYPNRAKVELRPLEADNQVHGVNFVRVPLIHGEMEIVGFRFGNAAYLTDVSEIPEASFYLLSGVDVLVIGALRYVPHPSHATVEQALVWAEKIGARQTWFTHISHDLAHEKTNRELPTGVQLASDGLKVSIIL
jgi:phosphoribosyl 1,2-cyclic phosphate phosphodiesterase